MSEPDIDALETEAEAQLLAEKAAPPPAGIELLGERPEPAEIAPPPPRHVPASQARQVLLTDQEFAVLDLLAEADAIFMQIPQAEDNQREAWRTELAHLENLVMRRAAIRAYPQRFVGQ